MFAITQTEYYLTLARILLATMGIFGGAVIFFGIVYGVVYYARYWK